MVDEWDVTVTSFSGNHIDVLITDAKGWKWRFNYGCLRSP